MIQRYNGITYQGDFQDFSEFCVNAYLSTLDQSTSKKNGNRLWVTMVTSHKDDENRP